MWPTFKLKDKKTQYISPSESYRRGEYHVGKRLPLNKQHLNFFLISEAFMVDYAIFQKVV